MKEGPFFRFPPRRSLPMITGIGGDGANRRLYVDSVLVAEDSQDKLAASSGNLFIGAAKTGAPVSFWKGLIDEVRIYNRVVQP